MAVSQYRTWLPLDDFFQIIGINPLWGNQFSSNTYFKNNTCGDVFFQYDYQHADRIGRDTIALAIQQAEQEMAREAGYNLMPDWTYDERLPYPRPSFPEAYNLTGSNPRWQLKSVEATRGHLIAGGTRLKALISAAAAVVRSDVDGDGYSELCTVTVPITITDTNEVHAYYAGEGGADEWEIRPIKISISGGFATITFKSWQIPIKGALDDLNATALDAETNTNYETTIDVYRVYNFEYPQVQFLWETYPNCCGTCTACQLGTQDGCFHLRDPRLGILVPAPTTYDARLGYSESEWSACREPDQVRLWYYSGYRDNTILRSYAELSPKWKFAIAVFAVSKFERAVCSCSNVNQFVEKWRRDGAFSSQNEGGFTMTAEQASNRLGTSLGALYAWRVIHQGDMRVNK